MSSETFTKGPWVSDKHNGQFLITADRPPMICDAVGVGIVYREADARLVATAPRLAELIEDGIPILEAVLEDREEANGEEDEVLRDLLDRFRSMRAVVTGSTRP